MTPTAQDTARRSLATRLLDLVERTGNRLPDPAALFLILMVVVWLVSWWLSGVSFSAIDPRSGEPIRIVDQLAGTSLTGFMFPFVSVTPAIVTGIIASLILIVALLALYKHRLAGRWRVVYVATAVASLYLNMFVFIVQSFQKVSFLRPYAPTGAEPPFLIAQVTTLVAFILLGVMAARRFHPNRLVM